MFAQVTTVAFEGVEARPVDVQVLVAPGLPSFNIVGLPDKAVGESRERVRAALTAVGLGLPPKRITVNLAPADLPKEGSHYDLPIALGLMMAAEAITVENLSDYVVIGELGLDGTVAPVTGALPAALSASALGKGLICPHLCGGEAAWASPDMPILAPPHLNTLISHFKGHSSLERPQPKMARQESGGLDLRDVKGQETAKRALEVAAAGGHHMVMTGPPGSGKSMLAARLPGILPPLAPSELLEVAMVYSMAGALVESGGLTSRRPFRAPHHSASMAALVGGGQRAKPGEIALAHLGVLFLDELPEFSPHVLDALRQPLESGIAVIARANHRVSYPSRFQLVAAMNPCRCGRAGEPGFTCRRGTSCAESYQSRVSGPLWDRIDIHIEMPAVSPSDLMLPPADEGSAEVARRVAQARQIQANRYGSGNQALRINAHCPPDVLDHVAELDAQAKTLLTQAADLAKLSARSYHRVLRVARTIADLDASPVIRRPHLAEALSLRNLSFDMKRAA